MKTSFLKFLGIFGFVIFVVGVGLLTMIGSLVPWVTYGHIVVGLLSILVWFAGEGTRSLGPKSSFWFKCNRVYSAIYCAAGYD